ncbi:MAG: DUF4838 domain-containing protein [Candidatus Avispirillum sp.]
MKKLISALLALLMLASTLAVGISAATIVKDETFIIGNADASADGKTNGQDAYMIKSYLAGKTYALDNICLDAADMNADGTVNATDAYYLKCLLAGKMSISDFENGSQIYRLTIAKNDIREYSIVVPEGYTREKNAYYAAEILQRYIWISTNYQFEPEILNDGTVPEKAIVIHDVDRHSALGEELGSEGYKYDVTDGVLNLYGTYRGNMYAAYDIVEKYLGYRFYDNNYTFSYKHRTVDIPEGLSESVQPKMKFRYCGQNVRQNAYDYYLPSHQNGTQIYGYSEERYGLQYGPQNVNAHSYAYYWQYATGIMPPDDGTMTLEERIVAKYNSGEKKNELTWQPCASNDDQYNTLFEGMLINLIRIENWGSACYAFTTTAKHLVEEGQKSVSFSINDNEEYCTCRNCNLKANGKLNNKTGEWIVPPEGFSGLYLDMANRAARDIQQYYPGMRVHTILYNHEIPSTVRPDKNLIVFFCGQACNNHYINSDECINDGQLHKGDNRATAESLKAWGEMCRESGAEMWFWYYGVTYHYYLVSMPNVFNIYYDYKFLYEECNVKGIYYEGGGRTYNYETLKAYLSTKMEWEPDMSYEQFTAYMKEYLYMYYGDGYEKIYEFIDMENTAGNECGTCFISNFDRPGDMYSYAYIDEHYEYMRQLLCDALEMADRDEYKERITVMLLCFDFLGLSSSYDRMYTDGDAASRALYEQRYTDMYNGMKERNIEVFSNPVTYTLPETIDFTVNPMTQIYGQGSRRPGVTP